MIIMRFEDWDAVDYFRELASKSVLARDGGFKFVRVSGLAALEEVVANMRKEKAFIAIDDTAEFTSSDSGSGYFEHKIYTVFFLHRFAVNDMDDSKRVMKLCKMLCRSFKSKLLVDAEKLKDALVYIDDDFNGRDIGNALLNGVTGMYMTFSFGLPEDLTLNEEEWDGE